MFDLKLADKTPEKQHTCFTVGNVAIGKDFLVIAGPCSVESEEQILEIAGRVKEAGANMLRGGAYKPRTSPYSFQGMGRKGLEYLRKAGDTVGLPIVTEVVDTRDVYLVSEAADMLQIGARNMQNYSLLQEAGRSGVPVMLKRGMYSTLAEWLNCAEYILKEGNDKVVLCERGIRTFESYLRNTLDLGAVAALKELTHLPIITDPSHATGRASLVEPMCLSSVMAGCDGFMVEVHNDPANALSDGDQSLTPDKFDTVMNKVSMLRQLRNDMEYPAG